MSEKYVTIKKKYLYATLVLVAIGVAGLIVLTSSRDGGAQNSNQKTQNGSSTVVSGTISFDQAVGQKAPNFTLVNSSGSPVTLADYQGKNVVLFFNEGSMCYPACWDQIKELANDSRFNNAQTQAFSIVIDPKSEWEKIMKKRPEYAAANLLFDTTRVVSEAYDVLSRRSSMHRGSYPGHTYIVIDKNGIIQYVLDDPSMAIHNDALAAEIAKLAS